MRFLFTSSALTLLLLFSSTSSAPATNSSSAATACPYDIDHASTMIPPACYANYTAAAVAPPTNCCWFVFAAYIYAAIRYSNATGEAFLPDPAASACSSAFVTTLIRRGLAHPSLLLSGDRCNISSSGLAAGAGKLPCLYPTITAVRSAVDLSPAVRSCSAPGVPDLLSDGQSCKSCQNSVIAATMTLLGVTKSKEFVPCGMATTIGVWSSAGPDIRRFRSYALCMVQVLENVGTLGTGDLIPSPPPPPSPPTAKSASDSTPKSKIAAISASAGIGIIAFIAVLSYAIVRHRRKESRAIRSWRSNGEDPDEEDQTDVIESALPTEGLYIFTKSELEQATDGYDPNLVLGEGGAGKVYLGKLPSGQHVAIKRVQKKKKLGELYKEIEILAKLRHRCLTTLVGYCVTEKEHVLVYEYMEGGNLSKALHHGELTWHTRVRIALDIAEGLAYLHEFSEGAVVHRDVKPTNILLSGSGRAKLSDFGVSRIVPTEVTHVSTEVKGTMGYVDPEYFSAGHVSESADVYSFGVVVLQLVTGLRAVVSTPSGGAESIAHSAHVAVTSAGGDGDEAIVGSLADRRLIRPGLDPNSIGEVFRVGYRCVKPYKNERPTMKEVLACLKGVLARMDGVPVVSTVEDDVLVGPSSSEGVTEGSSSLGSTS